jgi:hypothetical protein
MIRVLVMIAVAGFVLSVGSLAAAVAIGGPDVIARGGWNLADGDWNWGWSDHHHRGEHDRDRHAADRWTESAGPASSRNLAWSGADHLDLDLAADVHYIQTPAGGPGTVEITGPTRALEHVVIEDHSYRHNWLPKLTIVIRAPNISTFDVSGQNSLVIEGYKQGRLSLDISGDSEVKVSGETDEFKLDISGSGDADLAALKAKGASVDISGAADATIAPTDWARIDVTGMADVRLLTRPAKLETEISGAGKIRQGDESLDSSSPSPSPSPSPSVAKGAKT